ncbi:hypothetical protein ACVWY3_004118 [Bradyrhizobium sp. USDA 4486]
MADIEASVRDLVNRDRDCTEKVLAQMDLRGKINLLIGEWRAAGGGDVLPDVRDRAPSPGEDSRQSGARNRAPLSVSGGERWTKTRTRTGF